MKKLIPALYLFVMVVVCLPSNAAAIGSQPVDGPTAALAPAQRDINIATLAVILGSLLVGYERVSHGRRKTRKNPGDAHNNMQSRKL